MRPDERRVAIIAAMDTYIAALSAPLATPDGVRAAALTAAAAVAEHGTPGLWLEAARVDLHRSAMIAVEAMTTPRASVIDRRSRAVEVAEGARMLAVRSIYED